MGENFTGRNRRWRLWANSKLQGPLLIRIVVYWILFQSAQVSTTAILLFLSGGESVGIGIVVPPLVLSAFILPFALYDMIRFSNRFAGPAMRLERTIKALENGEPFQPMRTRPNDFLGEMIEGFNGVVSPARPEQIGPPNNAQRPTVAVAPVKLAQTGEAQHA